MQTDNGISLDQIQRHKGRIFSFSINNITNKLLIVEEKLISEYCLIKNTHEWTLPYQRSFSNHVIDGIWATTEALCCPMIYLNCWCVLLNKSYLFLVFNDLCFSHVVNLDSKVLAMEFIQFSSELFCLKEDIKQYKIWFLDSFEIFAYVRFFTLLSLFLWLLVHRVFFLF